MKEWVHVSVAMPESFLEEYINYKNSDPVLVYCVDRMQRIAYTRQYIDEDEIGEIRWISNCSEGWDITKHVTHWMELPEEP